MKIEKAILPLLLAICSLPVAAANPFASRLEPETPPKASGPPTPEVSYRGYIVIDDEIFAIVQFGGKQFALKKGGTANGIRITEITDGRILYRRNGKIHAKDLETAP